MLSYIKDSSHLRVSIKIIFMFIVDIFGTLCYNVVVVQSTTIKYLY